MSRNQPNPRFEHVYVVGRVWRRSRQGDGPTSLEDLDLTLTKAFFSEEAADAEVARLNELNGDDWLYFARLARLVPKSSDTEGTSEAS